MPIRGVGVFFIYGDTPPNSQQVPTPLPADTLFQPHNIRPGVPGVYNRDDIPLTYRDWNLNYRDPNEGFVGMHIFMPWVKHDLFPAYWEPAQVDIYRIQRKGSTGTDAQTLLFTTSPNTAAIPVGDPVVIWDQTDDNTITLNTFHTLSGYNVPTRSKLTVSACTPSAAYDTNGRRLIEVFMGTALPAIDFSPTFYTGDNGVSHSTMQLRHWSFYRNAATKELRRPVAGFASIVKEQIIPYEGFVVLGGNPFPSTNWDWSKEYLAFGQSLATELYNKEQQGLADIFGTIDPRKIAIKTENNPLHSWLNVNTTPGYRQLLNDVWYPACRNVWGQDNTLIIQGSQADYNTFLTQFDWASPLQQNTILASNKVKDSGITAPAPIGAVDFSNIAQSDWVASQLRAKVDALGYRGGAFLNFSVSADPDTTVMARKIGRLLTSANNADLQVWLDARHGSSPTTTTNAVDFFIINGGRIEAFYPEMRPYCSRAGRTFT